LADPEAMITRLFDTHGRRPDAELSDEGWSMAKLSPAETGLPMAVWVTENDGYPHDVRVKVSTVHGGGGSWRAAPSVAVRPRPRLVHRGRLDEADVALVGRWIELNRDVLVDYWDGKLSLTELLARLRRLA
jgi:hypothetical protein